MGVDSVRCRAYAIIRRNSEIIPIGDEPQESIDSIPVHCHGHFLSASPIDISYKITQGVSATPYSPTASAHPNRASRGSHLSECRSLRNFLFSSMVKLESSATASIRIPVVNILSII